MASQTTATTATHTASSSTTPEQFTMNASYGEISYQSVATEEGGDPLTMGGGGDDSSIDSLDNHPIVPISHHPSYSSSAAVTTGANGTSATILLPSIPGPPASLPLSALSPDSRRRRLIELDELLSDDEDDQDDHNQNMNFSHDHGNLQNLYRNNRGVVTAEEEDFDDDAMLMDDIINSYHETSSASDGDPNEPYDDNDDEFYDDITVESGDDSDSGGEMGLNDEYPADVITPIRKRWKYSWFAEVHRRRMDEIPEEGRDDLDDEEGSKSRRDKAWGSLDNHQRSWRSQRSVFLNIPINDGDTYAPDTDDTAALTAAAAVKKHEMLKGLFMEGMVKDLSPRGQMERLKKLALKNGFITKSVAIENSDVIPSDASRPEGTDDHPRDNVVPVVKILEKHAQNKEAEEEYELIDSFRMMKRTALSKAKAKSKDRSKKTSKKKKKEKDPTKSKSSKSTSGETKTKTSKGDASSNGEKRLKKKTKVKSTKSTSSSTTAATVSSDGPSPSHGVEVDEVVSPKRKSKRKSTISSPVEAPPLMDDHGKRVSVSSATEAKPTEDVGTRKSALVAVTESPYKDDVGKGDSVLAPRKDDDDKWDDSSNVPVAAAVEVPLKEDNRSSHSKSKSRRKHKTDAGGGTEVENSSHSASKSRRKLKGDTSVVGTTTSSDASVLSEKLSRTPSRSRRKLKADVELDVKSPLSGSKSRRKLKVNTSEISNGDETAQSESSKTRSSSKSKHKSKSVDKDDAELKSPSVSKRTSRLKRGSSLRELDASEILDDINETSRPSTKTPKAKANKADTNVSLDKYIASKSTGEKDKHDDRSVHSAPAASPTKTSRKGKSLDPGLTPTSRSRKRLSEGFSESQPLTPSQTRHRSRSRSKSPKPGKKSDVKRPLSTKDIGSPGLLEDEESSVGKKRGSRRSKTPEPLGDYTGISTDDESSHKEYSRSHSSSRKPKSMNRIRDEPASPNHSSSRKPTSLRQSDDSSQVSKGKK